MNRRTFFAWVTVGTLASSFPMALAAYSSSENTDNIASRPDQGLTPYIAKIEGNIILVKPS